MSTIYKDFLGSKDVKWWDGLVRTFTRKTSTGGTLSMNKIGAMCDVVEAYGSGTDYSSTSLGNALSAITTNACTLLFQPGTWNITDNVTVPANIALCIPQGAKFSIATGKTLTINGIILAGSYIVFDGTGTVAGAPVLMWKDPTWFSGTVTDTTTATWKTPKTSVMQTDTISETTAAAGVTIDGVLCKDSKVAASGGVDAGAAVGVIADIISEKTAAAGVTIDGVKLKDSQPYCDVINEKTAATGVTVDGVLCKDNKVTASGGIDAGATPGVITDIVAEKTSAAGVTVDGLLVKDGGISDGTNLIKTKIIDIGDWNMDATATVTVAHGLTLPNIRRVDATIQRDDGLFHFDLRVSTTAAISGAISVDGTNVSLDRTAGVGFDSTVYDSTSFNRGWIIITYVV